LLGVASIINSTFILNVLGDTLYEGPNRLDGRGFFRPLKNQDFEIGELQLDTFYMHLYANILDVDTMVFQYLLRNVLRLVWRQPLQV